MKWPTFRIGDLIEWTVALAVGFATVRACHSLPTWTRRWEVVGVWDRLAFVMDPMLWSVAVFEGLALAVERARGRGPRAWDVGRWTWSMAALYAVFKVSFDLVDKVLAIVLATRRGPSWNIFAYHLSFRLSTVFAEGHFACALTAVLVTLRLSRTPVAAVADAREWTGRAFAVIVLVWTVTSVLILQFLV
jgi:hypothetical protein